MKVKNRKSVLIMIIFLMIIFIPAAVIGTTNHLKNGGKSHNKSKDFYHDGKLYFYDYNVLLGNYTCENKICDYAYETVDDDKYSLNTYKDGKVDQIEMINKRYAFIIDTESGNVTDNYADIPIKLYDISTNKVIITLKAVKDYTIGIEGNHYIVQNEEGLWGVISFEDTINSDIPYEYQYIGLHNSTANNSTSLDADTFVVSSSAGWKLISNKNIDLTQTYTNEIYDFNSMYVITKANDLYYINDYQGNLIISYGYKEIDFIGQYFAVLNSDNEFYIIDPVTTLDKSSRYPATALSDIDYYETDEGIAIEVEGSEPEIIN